MSVISLLVAVLATLTTALLSGAVTPTADWSWPIGSAADPPRVHSRFAPPAQPWLAGHRGVDLVARQGTPVRAAGEGVVAYAGRLAGRGVVSVRHAGGIRTTYEPVLAEVSIGVAVRRGQVIGTVDRWTATHRGCAARSCLHWGARLAGRYVDPLSLLDPPTVRLLPLAAPESRPGVGLLVRQAQPFDRDVGVALGRGDRGVPQQLLDRTQVSATLQ